MSAWRKTCWALAAMMLAAWPAVAQDEAQTAPADAMPAEAAPQAAQNVIGSSEFVNTEVTTIFRVISDLTGWSIVMTPALSATPPRVNLWVKDMTAQQVLDEVGRLAQLVIQREGTVVHVMSFDEYAQVCGLAKTVLPLKYARAVPTSEIIRPYLQKEQQALVVADARGNAVVLMAPEAQTKALSELVKALDVPEQMEQVQVVRLVHLAADEVAHPLEQFLAEATRGERDASLPEYKVQFMVLAGLNTVVIRGDRFRVAKAVELLHELDVPTQTTIVSYELTYSDAAEIYRVLKDLESASVKAADMARLAGSQRMRLSVSEGANRIVVEGTEQDHQRVREIIAAVDRPLAQGTGGIRVYRLENTSARDVVDVLLDLIEEPSGMSSASVPTRSTPVLAMPSVPHGRSPDDMAPPKPIVQASGSTSDTFTPAPEGSVSITAAPEVNAVIIRAPAAEQEAFAEVISQLDRPRDQVMLEMTLVTVSSDDNFRFGLELGAADLGGNTNQVGFTTFGIGRVDSATGDLTIDPDAPFGLNYNLIRAGDYSLVINALETVGDVRITSSPKILVEDNTESTISLLSKEPYANISQGETSTITSFGDYAEAGTKLDVTPHISQEDWLRLEYAVELSSFRPRTAEQVKANLPPPARQSITSGTVRIPSDCMVVLGGLIDTRDEETIDRVPVLGHLPGLGVLFRNTDRRRQYQTLFVFIRPVVLRDPEFADLVSLSRPDRAAAHVSDEDLPSNSLQLLDLEPTPPAEPATMESSNG